MNISSVEFRIGSDLFSYATLKTILGTEETKEETLKLAEKYKINQCFFKYEKLLESEVDTIYVALPNFLHYSFAKEALLNNKHVIIEKPIMANYQELRELEELAHRKNRILLEAMNIHYMPAYLQWKYTSSL